MQYRCLIHRKLKYNVMGCGLWAVWVNENGIREALHLSCFFRCWNTYLYVWIGFFIVSIFQLWRKVLGGCLDCLGDLMRPKRLVSFGTNQYLNQKNKEMCSSNTIWVASEPDIAKKYQNSPNSNYYKYCTQTSAENFDTKLTKPDWRINVFFYWACDNEII